MADPYEHARTLLLAALEDLDKARDEGHGLVDFMILSITDDEDGQEWSGISNGIACPGTIRLGTLLYFYDRARDKVREDLGDGE